MFVKTGKREQSVIDITREARRNRMSDVELARTLMQKVKQLDQMGFDVEIRAKPRLGRPSNLSRMLRRQLPLDIGDV